MTAQTNDEGIYSILALQPGRYQITVAQSNFKTTKQEVTLEVAQSATLNFSLEPGAVTETVTITNDTPLVESTSSSIGEVIQGRQIVELPLNGRNVLELARLTPGVTQGVVGGFASGANGDAETYRGGNTGGAALSVNGQRTQANNFLLDGVDNNESLVNTDQHLSVGRSGAGISRANQRGDRRIRTRRRRDYQLASSNRDTNDFHGSSYLFIRNSAFDARPAFFDSVQNQRRTPLFRRSQFGGTVGGPVIIPGFGEGTPMFHNLKDKVFFFFSYDGLRQFLPRATETATVPTAAFRNGDFSQLLNPALSGIAPRLDSMGNPIVVRNCAGAIVTVGGIALRDR